MAAPPPARLIAERRVAREFVTRGATAAADAIEFDLARGSHARAFARLRARDVVLPAGGGKFYLDTQAWAKLRRTRRIRMAQALAFGTLAVLLASRL